jgi:hypothetical protein
MFYSWKGYFTLANFHIASKEIDDSKKELKDGI